MQPGLMGVTFASINDLPIKKTERKYHWAWIFVAGSNDVHPAHRAPNGFR